MTVSFRALGTTATLAVAAPDALPRARAALQAYLAEVDGACSRFRPESELTRLNASAGRRVVVGALLFEAVEVALAAARATGGLVDPTVGRTLSRSGYDATFRIVAERDADTFRARFERVPGWETVELDPRRHEVRLAAGVELDLGATAKALAADRGARLAAAAAGCGVLVALGGDVAVAGESPTGGWAVGMADDHTADGRSLETVAISEGGVATSSTTVRRWRSGTLDLHHLIDPRTGRPAITPWRTISVAGASCVAANSASTAAMILGGAAGDWLAERRLPARLVGHAGDIVRVAGWPAGAVAA